MSERDDALDARQLGPLFVAHLRLGLRGKASQAFAGRWAGKPWGLVVLLGMYMSIGLGIGVTAHRLDVFAYALAVHTLTFVLVGLSLAAESGDALFNPAEHDVLGHRPVSARTLLGAKALGLLAFTLLLALALNLPASLLGLHAAGARPWFPLVHLLATSALAAFSVAVAILAYGLVGRLVDRERFETIAAWSQVGVAIAFLGAWQALRPLLDRAEQLRLASMPPLVLLAPPTWFAALDASLAAPAEAEPEGVALSLLALVATLVLGRAALGRLAPAAVLAPHGWTAPRGLRAPAAGAIADRLGWWLGDPVERAAFRLAAAYLRRDREVKTRLYPSLVVFALFPLLGLVSRPGAGTTAIPLLSVAMLAMVPGVALEALRQSSQHAAAEVFAAAPLASTGPVFHGVRKAAMWYLLLPGLLLALALSALIVPGGLVLALPGLLALPTFSLLPGIFGDYIPLSIAPTRGQQAGTNVLLMTLSSGLLVVLLVTAWIAWRLDALPHLLAVEAAIVAPIHWGLGRHITRRPLRPGC